MPLKHRLNCANRQCPHVANEKKDYLIVTIPVIRNIEQKHGVYKYESGIYIGKPSQSKNIFLV